MKRQDPEHAGAAIKEGKLYRAEKMIRNYQKELERYLDGHGLKKNSGAPPETAGAAEAAEADAKTDISDSKTTRNTPHRERLLLHSCCAPCSSYVLEYLSPCFSITVLYYNPNIDNEEEYKKRAAEQQRLICAMNAEGADIRFIEGVHDTPRYLQQIRGLEQEPEGGRRCGVCFRMRLEEAARMAAEGAYDCFTTTLTVGPMKNAQRINEIGEELAQRFGVSWLPCDFKKKNGYKRSVELSGKYGLYRQNYCGCSFSVSQGNKEAKEH